MIGTFKSLLRPLSPAYLKAAWSAVFNLDYELTRSTMTACGALCGIAYVVFHFSEKAMGFRDWMPLRILCVALSVLIVLWPRNERYRLLRQIYWEVAVFILLPATQTFLFLLNDPHTYWNSSNIFWAFFLSLASKGPWLPVHLLLAEPAAYLIHMISQGPVSPERMRDMVDQRIILWITACAGLGIKTSLEVFHRRGLALAGANARAAEAESREKEIKAAYAELKRREEVIKRFVRPSLFEELLAGRDPTRFKTEKRNMAVMFCDIREFTHLTEVLSAEEKQDFLNRYFTLMTGPILANGGEVDKIMGDCVMGLFPDGRCAVRAAVDMRLRLQDFNRQMHAQGLPKIRNGIGIAKGEVLLGNFGSFEKLDRTVIGEAVNIASRLESKTKMYNLEVVVTDDIIRDLDNDFSHFRWIDLVKVKGSSRHLKLYEIYGHQPDEVRKYKDRTRDLMEKALTIYFGKGFRDAARLFRAMLEEVPPHRLQSEVLMDDILQYYIAHCDAWNSDLAGAWRQIERWEGVHVFYEK